MVLVLLLSFPTRAECLPSWPAVEQGCNTAYLALLLGMPAGMVPWGRGWWQSIGYRMLTLPMLVPIILCHR